MSKIRFLATGVLVALLVAAGCSGDSADDEVVAPDSGTEETTAVDEPSTTESAPSEEADDGGEESSDSDPAEAPEPEPEAEPDPEPVELTATDIGVSATTIKIAAVFPDVSVLNRQPGDLEAKYQVAVDAVNEAGGINGRQIEMVFSLYHPLQNVEIDALCVSNVEDEQVFAVIGILIRESSLCYTELNDTIVVNTFAVSPDLFTRSKAPLIAIDPIPTRLVEVNIDTLIETGHLSSGMRVALHGIASKEDLHNDYINVLEDRGIEIVSNTLRTIDNDIAAAEAELQVLAERWAADRAEVIIGSAPESAQDIIGFYDSTGLDIPILLPENTHVSLSLIQETLGYDLSVFHNAVALLRATDDATAYAQNFAGVADCVDRFQQATGEVVDVDPSTDGMDNLGPTIEACQGIEIFAAIARAAGPELTTESFGAAAENYGPIQITGLSKGSLGPGKFDISDAPAEIGHYDPETLAFVAS